MAEAPPTAMIATARRALRALNGETQTTKNGAQIVKVRKKGDEKWQEFTSQSKAEKKFSGLKTGDLSRLLAGKANKAVTSKFEACVVSNEAPISKRLAYVDFGSAVGFRKSINSAQDLDTYVSELVPRVLLPLSDKEAPKSLKDLLERVLSLSPREQRVVFEQTRRAEDKRVLEHSTSNLLGGRGAQIKSRRDEAAASAEADEECQRWLDELMVLFSVLRDMFEWS